MSSINVPTIVLFQGAAPQVHHSLIQFLLCGLFHPWDGFWSNVWAAGTTAGTLALAGATFSAIKQTRAEAADNERHHRDFFKPILVLKSTTSYSGRLRELKEKSNNRTTFRFETPAAVHNVGNGPALNLKIKLEWEDSPVLDSAEKIFSEFSTLSPVEQNSVFYFIQSDEGLSVDITKQNQGTSFSKRQSLVNILRIINRLPNDIEELLFSSKLYLAVYYDDIFGQAFLSKYRVAPSQLTATGTGTNPDDSGFEYNVHTIMLAVDNAVLVGAPQK
jgi:hypothetical protein